MASTILYFFVSNAHVGTIIEGSIAPSTRRRYGGEMN
jgi:hypothetical protein